MSEKYYFAVADVTLYTAKKENGQLKLTLDDSFSNDLERNKNYHFRSVGEKFVKDPGIALVNVIFSDHKESNLPEVRKRILENIVWDEKNKTFVYNEYLTLGTNQYPKPCQWERFESGEYTFLVNHYEVQILSTNLESPDLNDISKVLGYPDINIRKAE